MRIAYFDESGDDGFPQYSSPLFVLCATYLHYLHWRETQDLMVEFRRQLRTDFGFPVRAEMHTKYFLFNKLPYRTYGWTDQQRVDIVTLYCRLIASLRLSIINTAIVKPRIVKKDYDVLDTALKYTVQRIENDLNPSLNPNERVLIVSDAGRVLTMRRTTRKIQRINYIPSKFTGEHYRREIRCLIEDPLPKESHQSYFIQLCDVVAYIVYLYSLLLTDAGRIPNRLSGFMTMEHLREWLSILKPALNLKASSNEFGIVYHPK